MVEGSDRGNRWAGRDQSRRVGGAALDRYRSGLTSGLSRALASPCARSGPQVLADTEVIIADWV